MVYTCATTTANQAQRPSSGEKQKLCGKTFTQEVFSILHSSPVDEKNEILNLQKMGLPPPSKESVPRPHSLKIEYGKEV